MPLVLAPPTETQSLADRVRDLARGRRSARVAAGLFGFLAGTLAVAGLLVAADVVWHLPAFARATGLAFLLSTFGALFAFGVRRPWATTADPLATAHLLERQFPKFNDSLASAVAFEAGEPGDARFVAVTKLRATNIANRNDLDGIVPSRAAWKAFAAFALVAFTVVGGAAWTPAKAGLAAVRLFDPFGRHPWPTETLVEFLVPNTASPVAAKGEPFAVAVRFRGVLPEQWQLELRPAGGGEVTVDTVQFPEGDGPADGKLELAATTVIDGQRVAKDFEMRAAANDGATAWVPVRVLPAPRLVPLNDRSSPQITLTFPPHTRLPVVHLPDGAAVVEAVAGTRITLRAATDRAIVNAVFRNSTPPDALVPCLTALGGHPLLRGAVLLAAENYDEDLPVIVGGPDGRSLTADLVPPRPGLYALRFTDADGLTGVRLFDVRTFPDPAPTAFLDRPSAATDPLTVLPTTVATLRPRAEDRQFGVKSLFVEYRVNDGPWATIPAADAEGLGPAAGGLGFATQPLLLSATKAVAVAKFLKPDGTAPGDGDTVTLRAAATDFDTATLFKPPGRSGEVSLRVLSPSSLDAVIQKDLAALRPEIARIRDDQKRAADVAAGIKPAAAAGPEAKDALAAAEQLQKQIQNQFGDPADGLRARAEKLRDLIAGNALPKSPVTDRAEAVAKALARADETHGQKALPALAAAKQAAAAGDARAASIAAAKAGKEQAAAVEELAAALEKLETWAGPGELRGDARQARDQVTRAGQEASKAGEAVPAGAAPEQLSAPDRAALEAAAAKASQAADDTAGLMAKAGRVANEKDALAAKLRADAAAEPDAGKKADLTAAAGKAEAEARALRAAAEAAGGQGAADDLKAAAQATRENRPADAAAARTRAAAKLDAFRDALAEKPPADADELRKKAKKTGEDVDKLAEQQDELQKKAKAAAEEKDPAAQAEKLKQLAAEQDKLERQAERLSREAARDGNEPAAEQLKKAAEQMERAKESLDAGTPPPNPDEILDRLDDAREKLDAEEKKEQDELGREKREELAKLFGALLDRQKRAVEEADRLQAAAAKDGKWDRAKAASLAALADAETALGGEIRAFAEKQFAELPVFDRMARQAADQMKKAATRIADRKADALQGNLFEPEGEAAAHDTMTRPMRVALARLEAIGAALKPDDKPKPMPAAGGNDAAGGGEAGGGGGGQPGVSPLAQLKALRDWQKDLNARTADFARAHPDPETISEDDADDLKDLEAAQKEIADLFEKMLPLFQKGEDIP